MPRHTCSLSSSLILLGIGLAASAMGCGADAKDTQGGEAEAAVDESPLILVETSPVVTSRFPLRRVLQQLIDRAPGIAPITPTALYAQMFDTLNSEAHAQTAGPHCTGTMNGFAQECPRTEGILAATPPFEGDYIDSFAPVAVVNRFDLAPLDGTDCGEYRIVYGKHGTDPARDRLLLAFEGRLPNPTPGRGLEGCLPVAQLWATLGEIPSVNARAGVLERFFFEGFRAGRVTFLPVVDPAHYGMTEGLQAGGSSRGQIRASLFMPARTYFDGLPHGDDWQLREFQTRRVWDEGAYRLQVHGTTVKNNPDPSLFEANPAPGSKAEAFQTVDFLAMVPRLAKPPLGTASAALIGMRTAGQYNAGVSHVGADEDYLLRASGNVPFKRAITQELITLGRPDLRADDILRRATRQSCGGCHQASTLANANNLMGEGIEVPQALGGFTHIDENGGLSDAMIEVFLPHRAAVLRAFIDAPAAAIAAAKAADFASIGGDGSI